MAKKDAKEISATLIDMLQQRALEQENKPALVFLKGDEEERRISYAGLHATATAIAAELQALKLHGQTALLLYPPGIDFVCAFFGCLYANIIAIPVIPPHSNRNLPNLEAVMFDSKANTILTSTVLLGKLETLFSSEMRAIPYKLIATDTIDLDQQNQWIRPAIDANTLAFLQYTSGSTSAPKGAMIKHGNILHNQKVITSYFQTQPDDHFMSWLPHYHDMGLIGGILHPLHAGITCHMMAPAAFMKKPYAWLKVISDHRCTISGAPNFAYQLCVDRVSEEQLATLDLSCWKIAFNGAEPIRATTIRDFNRRFSECGFSQAAFLTCYGMAEATLMLTGVMRTTVPETLTFSRIGLAQGKIIQVKEHDDNACTTVSCGKPNHLLNITVVEPDALHVCGHMQVGEIWIAGDSVFDGYYLKMDSKDDFSEISLMQNNTRYFRTGDLGFTDTEGNLYITGRIKDIIIISGKNYYPQDLEFTAANSHPALTLDGCAAFTIDFDHGEQVVLVCEVNREYATKYHFKDIVDTVKTAIYEVFEISLHGFVLLKTGRVPKTSSGKVRRTATKHAYLGNELQVLDFWRATAKASVPHLSQENSLAFTELDDIQDWISQRVSSYLSVDLEQLDIDERLAVYGMDSTIALQLIGDLSEMLEQELDPTLLWEYPTIRSLSERIYEIRAISDLEG